MKSIISTLDAESGAFSHGGLGRRLPNRNQLVEVTLTLSGELDTPRQEPTVEQDALNVVSPPGVPSTE